jgi:hypothetical protein
VSEERAFEEFFRALRAEVVQQAAGDTDGAADPDFKENVFTRIVVEDYLSELGETDNASVCHCEPRRGQGIAKVNGYAINDDADEVHLFTTIYHGEADPAAVSTAALHEAAERAIRFYRYASDGLHRKMEASDEASDMARRIFDLAAGLGRLRVFILTDGRCPTVKFKKTTVGTVRVDVQVWDAPRLFRSGAGGRLRTDITIDLEELCGGAVPCLPMTKPASDYHAYLCMFPGRVLHRIYDEHGAALLEYNVRSFLQAKGKVNSGIRKTLLEEPQHFFAFNNGLVATAEKVEVVRGKDGGTCIRSMRGFQVVNGGQTTASIHRAVKEDRANVDDVLVPVKLTVVDSAALSTMVERISMSANSQNSVTVSDFSANSPFHVEVERLAGEVWMPGERGRWFYERARGQYQVARFREGSTAAARRRFEERTPPSRKFTKTDLAKYANAWDQKPAHVARGTQKNFVAFQADIARQGTEWQPDAGWFRAFVAKAILFKHVDRVAHQLAIKAYKANVVAYTVAYLAHRAGGRFDLERVWKHQAVSTELDGLLRVWVPQINAAFRASAGERNPSEWAKKEDCWAAISALDLARGRWSPPEFLVLAEDVVVDQTDDGGAIDRCREIGAGAWRKIHAWGRKTGKLKAFDVNVVEELALMAAGGWAKKPSKRKAVHAVRILDLAGSHGLLESRA